AASMVAPESVEKPIKYYDNNVVGMLRLLEACVRHGVQHFVFSSSAAVYGEPPEGWAAEETPTHPINPYGTSKLIGEWMLRDVAAAHGLRLQCCGTSMSPVLILEAASVRALRMLPI